MISRLGHFDARDDPAFGDNMTMTWELIETDDGTRVKIRAEEVTSGGVAVRSAGGNAAFGGRPRCHREFLAGR